MSVHTAGELKWMQEQSLETKIQMTQDRIKSWHDGWTRFGIVNDETGETRYVTLDTRDRWAEPELKTGEWIDTAEKGAIYVSFSGGKDSTVLKHIVDGMYDDVPSVFINTGLEYPEIQKFAMSQKNVVTVRPEMKFDEVIRRYGYPVITKRISDTIHYARKNLLENRETARTRLLKNAVSHNGHRSFFNCGKWAYMIDAPFDVSDHCCAIMKKNPMNKYAKKSGRMPTTAQMASESVQRRTQWIEHGCNAFSKKMPISNPMSFWTEQDVLHYIKKYNVPYCSVYGDIRVKQQADGDRVLDGQINVIDYLGCYEPEDVLETTGCKRTGCIFCMFGCHLEKEPNRFQRLKQTHPRQYEYCIGGGELVDGKWQPNKNGLGLGYVLDYIGVKYD